jgi:hypothetical protein
MAARPVPVSGKALWFRSACSDRASHLRLERARETGGKQMKETITAQQYIDFQTAFDFFNGQLFAGSLPQRRLT